MAYEILTICVVMSVDERTIFFEICWCAERIGGEKSENKNEPTYPAQTHVNEYHNSLISDYFL